MDFQPSLATQHRTQDTACSLVRHLWVPNNPSDGERSSHQTLVRSEDEERERTTTKLHPPETSSILWLGEICAAFVSIICLIGMVAMLASLHNRQLSTWTLPISPNALLAIFSTLSKSAVLFVLTKCLGQLKWIYFQQSAHRLRDFCTFDEASRGPLGAMLLLYHVRWKAAAASLGCLLIVITLAMEPFTQQILSYSSQIVALSSGDGASLPVTRAFGYTRSPNVENLLYRALYTPWEDLRSDYTCINNNCRWQNFTSLEICNACDDISYNIKRTCWMPNATRPDVAQPDISVEVCNITLPTEPHVSGISDATATAYGRNNLGPSPRFQTRAVGSSKSDAWVADDPGSIAKINILEFVEVPSNEGYDFTEKPTAYQCTLRWCTRHQVAMSIVNGRRLDDEVTLNDLKPAGCAPVISSKYFVSEEGWCALFPPQFLPTGNLRKAELAAYLETALSEQTHTINPHSFPVAAYTTMVLRDTIEDFFNSHVTIYKENIVTWDRQLGSNIFIPHHDNYTPLFDKYAAALNQWMVSVSSSQRPLGHSPRLNISIAGQVNVERTFVHVSWLWLILPASVVFFSISFLLTTIFFSTKKHGIVWKTSALAPLYHGLDTWPQEVETRTLNEMEEASDETWVRLGSDEHGRLLFLFLERDGSDHSRRTLLDNARAVLKSIGRFVFAM